jgi:hypothetical protein
MSPVESHIDSAQQEAPRDRCADTDEYLRSGVENPSRRTAAKSKNLSPFSPLPFEMGVHIESDE